MSYDLATPEERRKVSSRYDEGLAIAYRMKSMRHSVLMLNQLELAIIELLQL